LSRAPYPQARNRKKHGEHRLPKTPTKTFLFCNPATRNEGARIFPFSGKFRAFLWRSFFFFFGGGLSFFFASRWGPSTPPWWARRDFFLPWSVRAFGFFVFWVNRARARKGMLPFFAKAGPFFCLVNTILIPISNKKTNIRARAFFCAAVFPITVARRVWVQNISFPFVFLVFFFFFLSRPRSPGWRC